MSAITSKQLQLLENQLNWQEEKWDDLFFPVYQQKNTIISPKGEKIETGKKTLYTEKNGKIKIISTVGNNYSIILNEDLHKAVSQASNDLKINMMLSSNYKNKSTKLIYDISNKNANISIEGDEGLIIKLIVKNSYDGSEKISFDIGIYRLKCKNGLSVPIGKSISLAKKHIGINEEKFTENIKKFISKTLNEENFRAIKEKIENTIKDTNPEIPYTLLKSLPVNHFIPLMEGLKKYSQIPVTVKYYNQEYNLSESKDNNNFQELILEKKEKSKRSKKRIKTIENNVHHLRYDEQILNKWGLFNFLIKLIQFKINKNRRFDICKKMSKFML